MAQVMADGVCTDRIVIKNHAPRSATTIHGGCAVLFGLLFAAAGVLIVLVAADKIPVDEDDIHAPRWVIGVIGCIFLLPGLWLMLHGVRGILRKRRTAHLRQWHPDEPWIADYPWNRERAVSGTLWQALSPFIGVAFVGFFLLPFHWVIWTTGSWLFLFVIGLFDVILVVVLGALVYGVIRYLKYGRSELRFKEFPYHLGDAMEAELHCPQGLGNVDKLKFHLRFVDECYETHGSGKNRRQVVVSYQVYGDTQWIDRPHSYLSGEAIPIRFNLPEGDYVTNLAERPPRYWELEVIAEAPGVDYGAVFLLPIYPSVRRA